MQKEMRFVEAFDMVRIVIQQRHYVYVNARSGLEIYGILVWQLRG